MTHPEGIGVSYPLEGLAARYQPYGRLAIVRELAGYADAPDARMPLWGDRLGVYHPVTSDITALDQKAWQVLDAIGSSEAADSTITLADATAHSITTALVERHIIIPQGERIHLPFTTDVTPQELYIETTEACNFGCAGCAVGVDRYEAGLARTMDETLLDQLLERTVVSGQEKSMNNLHIKWAGGEPLMPRPFRLLQHGQEKIRALRELHPSIDITQVIISNGAYLTEETVTQIKAMDENMLVSVSLWGLGETQDTLRGARRERDKFPNIVSGIQRLHEAGITYNIHHVVTPENAEEFGNFIRSAWDTQSASFLAKGWNWPEGKQPLPLTISFFRPQTPEQLAMLNGGGYAAMVNGLRGGFAVIHELINRGLDIPAIDRIDYLQLFRVIPTVCGSGFNYLAAGPRGIAPCHEDLFLMQPNTDKLGSTNVIDLANQTYIKERDQLIGINIANPRVDDTTAQILALHGGTGCPRTARVENGGLLGTAPSIAPELYAPIIPELLSLEAMRRMATRE